MDIQIYLSKEESVENSFEWEYINKLGDTERRQLYLTNHSVIYMSLQNRNDTVEKIAKKDVILVAASSFREYDVIFINPRTNASQGISMEFSKNYQNVFEKVTKALCSIVY